MYVGSLECIAIEFSDNIALLKNMKVYVDSMDGIANFDSLCS